MSVIRYYSLYTYSTCIKCHTIILISNVYIDIFRQQDTKNDLEQFRAVIDSFPWETTFVPAARMDKNVFSSQNCFYIGSDSGHVIFTSTKLMNPPAVSFHLVFVFSYIYHNFNFIFSLHTLTQTIDLPEKSDPFRYTNCALINMECEMISILLHLARNELDLHGNGS